MKSMEKIHAVFNQCMITIVQALKGEEIKRIKEKKDKEIEESTMIREDS